MDSNELRLRDEVIYLHSLWHQGPPRNRSRNPNPNPRLASNPSRALHETSAATTFKVTGTSTKKQKTKPKKSKKAQKPPDSDPKPPVSDIEWTVQPIAAQPPGWPEPPSLPTSRPVTAEEEAKLTALRKQEKGLAACREFFARNGSDDEEDDDDDDDDDDDGDLEEDGCEEFELFVGLFAKDAQLRSYYEENNRGGVFSCLVCGGMGKKVSRRYKDCVGLVQHSLAISRTNKKRAHRAYGRVVCRILGWDFNRLPSVVLNTGHNLSEGGELRGNSNGNTEHLDSGDDNLNGDIKKDQNADMDEVEEEDDNAENLNVVVEDSNANGVELNSKDSLEEGNDGKLDDLDKRLLDTAGVNTRELVHVKEEEVEPESKDSQEAIIASGGANGGKSGVESQQ